MRSVIWDLGGTLLDTYPDVDRMLSWAAFGTVTRETLIEVATLTRVSSSHAITELSRRHDVPEQELRDAYDALENHWRRDPAPLMEGAREVIEAVHAGGGLNLVATHRDRGSATVLLDALALELGDEVDDLVCAPDGHPRKPDPRMNLLLLERHGLAPGDCVAVGDRTADVRAAAAAGIEAALLATPGIPLDAAGATRIGDLRELLPLLTR
jgi:HAD superfamily hydrolase (TIGR01509 family)